jgi:hypothetical protein
LAYVSNATFFGLTGRSPTTSADSPSTLRAYRVEIKRIRPPVDPSGPSITSGPANPPVTKVLNSQAKDEEKTRSDSSVLLVSSGQVPDRHVVLSNSVDGVEDFDLVR